MSMISQPRVWFITGSSTGFGRALTELILEHGETVIATARKPTVLAELTIKYPSDRLLALRLDVTRQEDIDDAFARAKEAFGHVDIVVNNAGYADIGEIESMDEAVARAVLDTNFWGATRITRAAVAFFREQNPPGHGGRLLQMSSYLGLVGNASDGFYVASKFALEGMTETLVQELDPAWNIKITLLEPGWFRSNAVGTASWSAPHPAYTNPDLPTNRIRAIWESFKPSGDTRKAVEVFYRVAAIPDPPLHFVVGKDAIIAVRKKLAELQESLDKYESWSEDLDVKE